MWEGFAGLLTALLSVLQEWKLLSCSHGQELSQFAVPAPDWSFALVKPIRSQIGSLTQLLNLTTTKKFPPQIVRFWFIRPKPRLVYVGVFIQFLEYILNTFKYIVHIHSLYVNTMIQNLIYETKRLVCNIFFSF